MHHGSALIARPCQHSVEEAQNVLMLLPSCVVYSGAVEIVKSPRIRTAGQEVGAQHDSAASRSPMQQREVVRPLHAAPAALLHLADGIMYPGGTSAKVEGGMSEDETRKRKFELV